VRGKCKQEKQGKRGEGQRNRAGVELEGRRGTDAPATT